jgi:membrane-associated phospholipid phosphatase
MASDVSDAAHVAANADWLRMGAYAAGLTLASSLLDRSADQFVKDHSETGSLKAVIRIGNALPALAFVGSAAVALDGSDPARTRTGYAAMEAGGTAYLAATLLKYAIGRARPENEVGNHAFKPFSKAAGYDSLPSAHTIAAWAMATPFAEQYDAPWLYGVAAITNLARVGSREHWLSDTVAGSVLGFAVGKVFLESSRAPKKGEPRVLIHPSGIDLAWELN